MCSNATAGTSATPYIFTGNNVPSAPGSAPTCLPTIYASNYNSSLCQPTLICTGSTAVRKKPHRNINAPVYIATNWWKSGDSQGTARCINDDELTNVENISRGIDDGLALSDTKTNEILSKLENILSSL